MKPSHAFMAGLAALVAALAWPNTAAFAMLSSTPRAETWTTNGYVTAIAVTPTTVYIGGEFTQVGPATSAPGSADWVPRKCLAAFDAGTGQATAWNPNPDGNINTIAVLEGVVYIGGWFTNVGGQDRFRLAAIDTATGQATAWDPAMEGLIILSLAASGTTVYAGGGFSSIGGQARSNLAALDAATGLATAWNPGVDNGVHSLAVTDSTIYFGGDFDVAGGLPRHNAAAADKTTGQVTAWAPNPNDIIYGMAVSGATVYAGGVFTSVGGQARNYLAALDAATGEATAWNPSPNADVRSIAMSGSTLYAGGCFDNAGGQNRMGVVALDAVTGLATAWDPQVYGCVFALGLSGSTVYTGGSFSKVGGVSRTNFAEFRELDTTPPTGTIVINGNATATKSAGVTLALSWNDGAGLGVSRMRFSNDGTTWSPWEALASARPYTLPGGDGYKTVRVQYLDRANNRSAVCSDYIRLDTVPPTGGILINNNAATTATRAVTLNLNWADTGAGVTRMRFSDNGSTWTNWVSQKATRSHTLPAGLGNHTVRVQYADAAQNYSPIYSDYIKIVAP
jgi:hypothetical protein